MTTRKPYTINFKKKDMKTLQEKMEYLESLSFHDLKAAFQELGIPKVWKIRTKQPKLLENASKALIALHEKMQADEDAKLAEKEGMSLEILQENFHRVQKALLNRPSPAARTILLKKLEALEDAITKVESKSEDARVESLKQENEKLAIEVEKKRRRKEIAINKKKIAEKKLAKLEEEVKVQDKMKEAKKASK